jgi:mono/diheme cytochrome c family protein
VRRASAAALAAVALAAAASTLATAQPTGGERSVWGGVYSDAQAARGGVLYSTHCATCHGPTLDGGEMAPALVGGVFGSEWNGLPLGDLFDRIRTSMPQGAPGSLSRQETADILAFILSAGGFPRGDVELPIRPEQLRQIKFEANRP